MGNVAEAGNSKILIVDDQQVLRTLLVKFMKKAGLEPIEAEDGKKAIELYQATRPAVVLSDIMMPRMDGLTLLNEIKKIDSSAVVILMTGYGNEDILLKALRGGAANYFKKPFNFHEIVEVVKHLIKHQSEIDITKVYSPFLVEESKRFVLTAGDADIFPIINQIAMHLHNIATESETVNVKVGLEEMLKNAVEHGNLGITQEEKNSAIEDGTFGDLLKSRLEDADRAKKEITVIANVTPDRFQVSIKDEGEGFDWRSLPELHPESLLQYSGRGIFLTRIYFDKVEYNDRGNQVTLIKLKNAPRGSDT